MQDRKGEIRYHFRQHSVCLQSLGNLVRLYFFKVYQNQVGLSGMFECHTLGLGTMSEAQGCRLLARVAGLGNSLRWVLTDLGMVFLDPIRV